MIDRNTKELVSTVKASREERSRENVNQDKTIVLPSASEGIVAGIVAAYEGSRNGRDRYRVQVLGGDGLAPTGEYYTGAVANRTSGDTLSTGTRVTLRVVDGEPPLILSGTGDSGGGTTTISFSGIPPHAHIDGNSGGVLGGLYAPSGD